MSPAARRLNILPVCVNERQLYENVGGLLDQPFRVFGSDSRVYCGVTTSARYDFNKN